MYGEGEVDKHKLCDDDGDGHDRFHTALFSALEQTHCARM